LHSFHLRVPAEVPARKYPGRILVNGS
jgi:hypothetical protein